MSPFNQSMNQLVSCNNYFNADADANPNPNLNININALRIGKTRFSLALCELHYTPMHGKSRNSCPNIEGHFLVINTFNGPTGIIMDEYEEYTEYNTDEENSSDTDENDDNSISSNTPTHISHILDLYQREYAAIENNVQSVPHTKIRNYHNIIRRPNYIKPEIAECFELSTQEHIAIIKTIWIKLIQRKWKKVFALKQQILQQRSSLSSVYARQITGKWPDHCLNLPGLKGMLSDLL